MNRRQTLGLLGASAFSLSSLTLTGCDTANTTRLNFDPNNPEDLHTMHRKLAYTLDERLVYWNIDALRMGFKDGVLTPFWNMHVGIIYRLDNIQDFKYRVNYIMKIFYSDLKTGELLQRFDNPYTGEAREVSQPKLFKSVNIHGLTGIERMPSSAPKAENAGLSYRNDEIGPAKIIGDDIWLNADMIFRSETPNRASRLIQVNDWSTYHGSMNDLTNPYLTSAPATHTFNDLNSFNHPWIGMEGIQAWSISRGFGRKSHSVHTMPEAWKMFTADTHPELLTDSPDFADIQ